MNFVWKAFIPLVAHLGREGMVDRNKKKCGRSQLTIDWKKIATCILHAGTAKWNVGRIIYDLQRPTDPGNWRGNQWELGLSASGQQRDSFILEGGWVNAVRDEAKHHPLTPTA